MSDLTRLLLSSRPLSWINTAYPFALAYLVGTGGIDVVGVIGTLFFLIPYNFAMYGINDVFDYESDLRNPRKGGAEGALVPPRLHRTVLISTTLVCLPFLVFLIIVGSWPSWIVLAVVMLAVVAYSAPPLRTKEIPVLDSITSSTHFVGPAVYGLVLTGAEWTSTTWLVLIGFFLWGAASQAFGAVQDIIPDREAGIASIATVFGAAGTVRAAIVCWLAAGVCVAATGWPLAPLGLLALPYVIAVWPFRDLTDATSGAARRGWARFLWLNYGCGAALTIWLLAVAFVLR
ncbi:prenyltransferase [Microbacterium gorillae]|uniref:prenyltransferase n=1 Tax=Microbacterium gorillae TaxID=1231063 RepID=UPI00058DF674|nr:prenyltransferase [Microbacterium gorillae]